MKKIKFKNIAHIMKEWDKVQGKYSKFGATDTEPDWHFQDALRHAYQGVRKVPVDGNWELFSSVPGSRAAAKELTKFTEEAVAAILQGSREKFSVEDARDHIWRVNL
jgi:hypothetical protein